MKNMRDVLLRRSGFFAGLTAAGVLLLIQSAGATVIAYDGFAAGGVEDGRATNATTYTTSPASTDGLNNDSLHGQSPVSIGFDDDDAWSATNGVVAANVYFQAQLGGLRYPGFEPNTPGQARFFRSSGTTTTPKWAERSASTTDISDVQWVAILMDFSSSPTNTWSQDLRVTLQYGEPGDTTAPYDGAWEPTRFGVRQSSGKAFYATSAGASRVNVESDSALSPGTHLFLLKFDDRPGSSGNNRYDDVTLWVDPVLTANPNDLVGGLSAVSITRSDLGGTMHPFDKITISAAVKSGEQIVFDEFIMTDDYQDIWTPLAELTNAIQTVDATYIRSGQVNGNFNDNGQMIIGPTTGDLLKGLIEFDLGVIPTYNEITSISLEATTYIGSSGINDVGAPGDFTLFHVYEYGFDIDETTATWSEPDVDASDVAGGSSGTLLSSSSFDVEVQGQEVAFRDSVAFRTAVADALAGDKILRLILRADDETLGVHNFARFSDETVTPASDRPALRITYRLLPFPGTIILVN